MPRLITIALLLVAGWVIFGAPLPISVSPLSPNANLPTFEQRQLEAAVLRQADENGLLQQDPVREEQRLAVLETFEQLKDSPCDKSLRRAFAQTLVPFIHMDAKSWDRPPVETFEVDGKVLNATRYLDGSARQKIAEAMMSGYLRPNELPGAAGIAAALSEKHSGRKAAFDSSGRAANCDQTS